MSRKQREKRARAIQTTKQAVPAREPAGSDDPPEPAGGGSGSVNRLGLIVAVVGIAGLLGLVVYLGDAPPPRPAPKAEASHADTGSAQPDDSPLEEWRAAFPHAIPVSSERDFVRGPGSASVTIVEFSDFECPFCRKASYSLEEIVDRYPEDVRLVYKNFPLDMACNSDMAKQLHPYGCKTAIMARCAGKSDRGLFWRFHDAIFNRDGIDDGTLEEITDELGLTDESFASCVASRETFDEVREDIELARTLGVHATPTLFVNGRRARSYEPDALSTVIDHIIATQ